MQTTLVVMAAGMGSRFGSLKQMQPVDEAGRGLLEYSVFDAAAAGFDRVVFIIRKSFAREFEQSVGRACSRLIDVDYVYQEMDSCLPEGFCVPEGREKPWGTGHAVLCAKDAVTTPFGVINADDYYGRSSFELLHSHLTGGKGSCMVAFCLSKTLSENGTVSRGVCQTRCGYLKTITEHTALSRESNFAPDTPVSMNMWGFMPSFFSQLEEGFAAFLPAMADPQKSEYFLPSVVDSLLGQGERVRVLQSREKWYGITYREDLESLRLALARMSEDGKYY